MEDEVHSDRRGRAIAAALFAFALLMPAAAPAQEADVVGTWSGTLHVQAGVELPLVVHLRREDGQLRATMDSPAQGAMGLPVDTARFVDGELTLHLVAIGGTYEGRLVEPDRLVGEWRQGPGSLPLELRRTEGTPALVRPQHPTPPFPYRSEEVRFRNGAAGIELAGTLTLPPGAGPFPAVALVTGSGPQDRDETLLGHKPFLVIADHLTRAGIAVLRYDDRGVGESGGDFAAGTTVDFAGDAAAAIAYLQTHGAVDARRIGLIGHSEGGLIAPLVATGTHGAQRADVAFVVLLAGPGLPGGEILMLQAEALSRASGSTPEQTATALRFQEQIQAILRAEPDADLRRERVREMLRTALAAMTPAERAAIPADRESAWIDAQAATVGTEWYREFVLLDPRPMLRQLRVPVLALFGELDVQVPPQPNMAAMREALDAAGNRDATIVELPGLNHLFQTATTGSPAEYATLEETFAPVALERIASWIMQRFGPGVGKD
jgi:uncharacterized protein